MDIKGFCNAIFGGGIVTVVRDNVGEQSTDFLLAGYGKINRKKIYVIFHEGLMSFKRCEHIVEIIKSAIKDKAPLIILHKSLGAKIQEGSLALLGYGSVFKTLQKASGRIPLITIISGNCVGGSAYMSGLMDFVFMIENESFLFVTGAKVIESMTGEKCTNNQLGSANLHFYETGTAHFISKSEKECYKDVRMLLEYFLFKKTSYKAVNKEQWDVFPDNPRAIYDMSQIVSNVLDNNSMLQLQGGYASNILIAFGRINGRTVGIIANQPLYLNGALESKSATKAANFVRFCDNMKIPIITFVDTPGYISGKEYERQGLVKNGCKLLQSYAKATTACITIIIRKAYGGAYIAMGSKGLGVDCVLAWQEANIAVMGEKASSVVLKDKKIVKEDYSRVVDAVICKEETRAILIKLLKHKRVNFRKAIYDSE